MLPSEPFPARSIAIGGILLALMLGGCGTQTVLVPPGTVVRLAAPTQAKIAVYNKDAKTWDVQANEVTLPEGYYVAPPPATTKP